MNIVILGSGRGSNARAILLAARDGKLGSGSIAALYSDRPDAPFLNLGPEFGVEARFLDPGPYKTKLTGEAESRYIDAILEKKADLVVLAGFMRVIKPSLINAFSRKIINLHPSLLPSFKGLDAIRQAYEYGVKVTGCTVHFVTADVDSGPILDQQAVRIEDEDSLERVEEKVHECEHQLLPAVIARMSEGWKG